MGLPREELKVVTDMPRGAKVELVELTKLFGPVVAVDRASLAVEPGEFLTLLGPSGSGKTTTLMLITGFESPTAGEILISGRRVTHVPPYRRNLGMVFQHYALFPHMTVYDNVAFPLRARSVNRTEIERSVEEALGRVRLLGYESRFPHQLSGGQQQRVALARALVFNPPVLLMDEPLGALDKKLREQMQLEIKHIQREIHVTVIYVTHDQEEALTMSDRVAVMNQGRIVQLGTPEDLYERPADPFVADFIGESNFFEVSVFRPGSQFAEAVTADGLELLLLSRQELSVEVRTVVALRPERIVLAARDQTYGSNSELTGRLQWQEGVIEEVVYIGEMRKYRVRVRGQLLIAKQQASSEVPYFAEGEKVRVGWSPGDLKVLQTHDVTVGGKRLEDPSKPGEQVRGGP